MTVRIQAVDLRDAARKSRAIRADGATEVYLDIEVHIDTDASVAFGSMGGRQASSDSLRYVGTPRGLAGLIADVRSLGIADGVVLVTPHEAHVTNLMLGELAPGLGSRP